VSATTTIARRRFLKTVALAAGAPWIVPSSVFGGEGTVAPGDRIVVYTDGLIDIDPGNDRFLDDQELEALLLRLRAVTPAEMVSALCAQVRRLRGGGEGEDDLTLLVAALE